jgi:hypothetical protein
MPVLADLLDTASVDIPRNPKGETPRLAERERKVRVVNERRAIELERIRADGQTCLDSERPHRSLRNKDSEAGAPKFDQNFT